MSNKEREVLEIPQAVKDEVKGLLEGGKGELVYIGQYENHEAYQFMTGGKKLTGHPVIILYLREGDMAYEVPSSDSLEVLSEIYGEE